MGVLNVVNDNFNRTNAIGWGVSTSGHTWQYDGGGSTLSSIDTNVGLILGNGGFGYSYIDSGYVICTTYATFLSTGTGGLIVRRLDSKNLLVYYNDGKLYKKENDGFSVLATGVAYTNGDTIKIIDSGSVIACYINDSLKITYNTTLFNTNTKQGIYQGSGANVVIDNYNVDIAGSSASCINLMNGQSQLHIIGGGL